MPPLSRLRLLWLPGLLAVAFGLLLAAALHLPATAQAGSQAAAETPPPRDLHITQFFTDGFEVAWAPVTSTMAGGRYRLSVAERFDGMPVFRAVTSDLLATSVVVTGLLPGTTYYIRLYTQFMAQQGQPTELVSKPAQLIATTAADARVLIAVYFAADNDLAPYIPLVQERLRAGAMLNPNADVFFFADGDQDGDTMLYLASGGVLTPTNAVAERWGSSELDSADPAVLTWFLQYARQGRSDAKTVVALMGHGVPLAPELAWIPPSSPGDPTPAPAPGIPPLKPQGLDYTPTDVTDGGYMSVAGMGKALAAATQDGTAPVDLLFFDQCFQGNLDLLYEVRSAAHVIVASPNYAWLVAPYALYLPHFAPASTPERMADDVIHIYQRLLNNSNPNAIFWLRSADIPPIATAVSQLGDALQAALDAGETWPIQQAALQSKYVDTTQCGRGHLHLGAPDELLGAGSFAFNLRTQFGQGDPYGVDLAVEQMLASLSAISSTFRIGHPYLDRTELWDYDDTVTIMAPLSRNTPPQVAWRASLYRSATPFRALWVADPTQSVIVSQTFAFVVDGRWDEFLARWFTGPMTPTVGEWCNYTPPGVVETEDAPELAVTTHSQSNQLMLAWTAPQDVEPALYQVLVRKPGSIGQVLAAALEVDQLRYVLQAPDAGEYQVTVVAVDGTGTVVAASSAVAWAAGNSLFLPTIRN